MVKASTALRGAAQLLERTGWTQHASARLSNGAACMVDDPSARMYSAVGAIRRVAPDCRDWMSAVGALSAHLEFHGLPRNVDEFNDAPGTGRRQVVERMLSAARLTTAY